MSRQKREQAAKGIADQRAKLRQRRDRIENDQAFIDARNQLQNDYGVDIIGEIMAGIDESVAMTRWLENWLNLDIGENKE